MNKVKATVIIPTTIDRGMLLPYSVGSVQNQTVKDIEIFIIGDGVYDETREVIHDLQSKDSRIKFFDHPKHERRGEIYRDKAISNARSNLICYLCDRDLMLPNHLELHLEASQNFDFLSSMYIRINPKGIPRLDHYFRYFGQGNHLPPEISLRTGGLSMISHTKPFYDSLPMGWSTTPEGIATDSFMWGKFVKNRACRTFSISSPTILYFKRQQHPGWSSMKRLKDLVQWYPTLTDERMLLELKERALLELLNESNNIRRQRDILKKRIVELENQKQSISSQ